MNWTSTTTIIGANVITSNYDVVKEEDHIDGIDYELHSHFSYPISVHRDITHCSWRGTGTAAAFNTGLIRQKFSLPENKVVYTGHVKLQVDIDNIATRVALNPEEARILASALMYLADEAEKLNNL